LKAFAIDKARGLLLGIKLVVGEVGVTCLVLLGLIELVAGALIFQK
jgi:hypothetical protein